MRGRGFAGRDLVDETCGDFDGGWGGRGAGVAVPIGGEFREFCKGIGGIGLPLGGEG